MINPIAYSYWRRIKAGARKFADVPEKIKEDVRAVAQEEVEAGKITQEEVDRLIGETE